MATFVDPTFYVKIFSPFETYFEGEATALSAINKTGPFDVLAGHANFISLLPAGTVKVLTRFGRRDFKINKGILKVSDNKVVLFANI